MNPYVIGLIGGTVTTFAFIRLLIWYFDATVCVECYKKIKKKESVSAGYRNREMRLCKECHGQN